jgi:hypothetical protein
MNDIKTLMADTDFQNRFGMHTQAFQELAANAILFTVSKLSGGQVLASTPESTMGFSARAAREGGAVDPKFSQPNVQAALIAAQAEEIKRLTAERDEAARLSHQYRNERDAQVDDIKQRDIAIRAAADRLVEVTKERNDARAEVERLKRENDTLASCLTRDQKALRDAGFSLDGDEWKPPREDPLIRFQNIARHTDRALRAIAAGTTPNIDAIPDGCIKIHLREVLAQFDKLKEFKAYVHKRLDEMNIPQFGSHICHISARLDDVAAHQIPPGATIWHPEDSFHKLCIAACHEANRARGLYPNPNHLTLALAEEAGEITKAVLDHRQGKADLASVRKEIVQTMAMCLRLATEGDPTVELTWSQS